MKFVGFIAEYHNIDGAIPYNNIFQDSVESNSPLSLNVIVYLKKGVLIGGWMNIFKDLKTGVLVGANAFYTDGIWVWPEYFSFYLKSSPNILINQEFIEYLVTKNFIFTGTERLKFEESKFEEEVFALMEKLTIPAGA